MPGFSKFSQGPTVLLDTEQSVQGDTVSSSSRSRLVAMSSATQILRDQDIVESATIPVPQGDASPELDRTRNKTVNRKLDIALLPLLSLLYLFNGLDRGNVGNAETQGFTRDIGALPDDLNEAVSLFFVTFVVLQPASAAVGRYLGARHWISIMMGV